MKLNEKIQYYRKAAKLSQEELAARVGVSRQAVSKWELAEATPEVDKLLALARVFGVTTDELLSEDEPAPVNEQSLEEAPPVPPGGVPSAGDGFDRATNWLDRMIRRYGWLAGVYVALSGLGFLLIGGLARWGFGAMFSSANQMMGGFGGGVTFSPGTPQWAQDAILEEIGLGAAASPLSGVQGFFLGFANVFILLGAVTLIAGVILAAVLYKKGRK